MEKKDTSLRLSNKQQKLIPRDISESLGKLPPQALDLEKAVLGALMLEKHAIDVVKGFLRKEHFYAETHGEIYNAIFGLSRESAPIDMRTVRHRLRETGKIEMIGGDFYIAELTADVSSAVNIEYHARKIVELGLKRDLITIASQIHHEGYEDTTDVFEMLDRVTSNLLHIKETSTFDNHEEKIKALWEQRQVVVEPPADIPLITIDGVPVLTIGNHALLMGKKKSRKTLFVTWLVDQYFKQNHSTCADDIILFDTEQGKSHVWRVRKKIQRLTGLELPIFYLRGMLPAARREFIMSTCKYWPKRPRFIVIDGIRDLMSNINDPVESTEVIVWMEDLIVQNNIGIINILHQNKTDSNARGHIGTELANKAEVTMELEKDDKTGFTKVKCESSREKEFETFEFTHGVDDLPELLGPSAPVDHKHGMTDSEQRDRLAETFEDSTLTRTEAIKGIMIHFDTSKNKAEKFLTEYVRKGWILKTGKEKDPKSYYKFLSVEPPEGFVPVDEAKERRAQAPQIFEAPPVEERDEDIPVIEPAEEEETEPEDLF